MVFPLVDHDSGLALLKYDCFSFISASVFSFNALSRKCVGRIFEAMHVVSLCAIDSL